MFPIIANMKFSILKYVFICMIGESNDGNKSASFVCARMFILLYVFRAQVVCVGQHRYNMSKYVYESVSCISNPALMQSPDALLAKMLIVDTMDFVLQ